MILAVRKLQFGNGEEQVGFEMVDVVAKDANQLEITQTMIEETISAVDGRWRFWDGERLLYGHKGKVPKHEKGEEIYFLLERILGRKL